MKPDRQTGRAPASAAECTSVRPLARHPCTRRIHAGFLSVLFTPYIRTHHIRHCQYGLLPEGCIAASRRHQLVVDHSPPLPPPPPSPATDLSPAAAFALIRHYILRHRPDLTHFLHAACDVKNAHGSVALIACYLAFALRHESTGHPLDLSAALYLLSYYSSARATYIQLGRTFEQHWQTDALDQGESMASHIFGYLVTVTIVPALARCLSPPPILTLVHDDATLAAPLLAAAASHLTIPAPGPPPSTPSTSSSPTDPTPDTPLPFAIRHLAIALSTIPMRPRRV